jgi:SNF2 family DNA or RNA helicase
MLLRLRQLTAHVLMLQNVMQDLLEREDIEAIRDVVKDAAADSSTRRGQTIIVIRKQLEAFAAKEKKRTATKNTSNSFPEDDDDLMEDNDLDEHQALSDEDGNNRRAGRKLTGAQFGKDYNFKPYLNSLATGDDWKAKKKRSQCGSCGRTPPIDPWQTSCGHLLCSACYEEAEILSAEQGKHQATCIGCGQVFAYARQLASVEESNTAGPETRGKRQRNDKKQEKIEQEDIAEEWLNLGGEGVLPSAKTIAIKAQLMNWFDQKGDAKPPKVIFYTQFLAMIRILAKVCQEEGWQTEQVCYPSDSRRLGKPYGLQRVLRALWMSSTD